MRDYLSNFPRNSGMAWITKLTDKGNTDWQYFYNGLFNNDDG